ncbi:MAG: MarR family winged helix-turn-helix transcriptional regulator [Jiangellaceae bacterium]
MPEPDTPAQRVATALAKIGLALRTQAWEEAGRRGLTPTQGQVLAVVHARGPARIGAVAREVGVTSATISDSVSALEAKGLIRRRSLPHDGRAVEVRLTGRGRRIAVSAAAWPDAIADAVGSLPSAEQTTMLRALVGVIRMLQDTGRIPVARMCVSCRYFAPHVHDDPAFPHHCRFVDARFGDRSLRIDCADFDAAPATQAADGLSAVLTVRTPGGSP